jgi:uncharacterized FlaG/YvyC family protein
MNLLSPKQSDQNEKSTIKQEIEALKKIIEQINEVAQRFGLKMVLGEDDKGNSIVRIFSKINNKEVTSIPLRILLAKIFNATKQGDGSPGDEVNPEFLA